MTMAHGLCVCLLVYLIDGYLNLVELKKYMTIIIKVNE